MQIPDFVIEGEFIKAANCKCRNIIIYKKKVEKRLFFPSNVPPFPTLSLILRYLQIAVKANLKFKPVTHIGNLNFIILSASIVCLQVRIN